MKCSSLSFLTIFSLFFFISASSKAQIHWMEQQVLKASSAKSVQLAQKMLARFEGVRQSKLLLSGGLRQTLKYFAFTPMWKAAFWCSGQRAILSP